MPAGVSAKSNLDHGLVDVRLTSLSSVHDDLKASYLQLLSGSELSRWRRYLVNEPRDQYLVSRALLRTTLSLYADVPADAWVFEVNGFGRPFIAQPSEHRHIQFNLSHTRSLVACAVADRLQLGIDVEDARRKVDPLELGSSVLAAPELARLVRAVPAERPDIFFAYWTLKEAYVKARGEGLTIPLKDFWFDLNGSVPIVHFKDRCADPAHWDFRQFTPAAGYHLALAVPSAGQPMTVQTTWTTPLVPRFRSS